MNFDPKAIIKPKTNGGMVRNLDNRELADFIAKALAEFVKECLSDPGAEIPEDVQAGMSERILAYLDAPAEGGDDGGEMK